MIQKTILTLNPRFIWNKSTNLIALEKNAFIIKLETHTTKDVADSHINGILTVIWRDRDKIIKKNPKMVYVSSVNPGEKKGPHLHTKRNSYFTCIHGKVVFIIKEPTGKYIEIESGENNSVMVFVPKNIPSAHINLSKNVSRVLCLADIAWRPNDNEMKNVTFDDYDWSKLIKRCQNSQTQLAS